MSISLILQYGFLGIILIILLFFILLFLWFLFCFLIALTLDKIGIFQEIIDDKLHEVLNPCCFSNKKGGVK